MHELSSELIKAEKNETFRTKCFSKICILKELSGNENNQKQRVMEKYFTFMEGNFVSLLFITLIITSSLKIFTLNFR